MQHHRLDGSAIRIDGALVNVTGELHGVEPVTAQELADGQQPERLGAGPELVASAGVPEGRLEPAGLEFEQAGTPMPSVRLERISEQPEVGPAATTRVNQPLPGAAGRASEPLGRAGTPGGFMHGHGWSARQASSR